VVEAGKGKDPSDEIGKVTGTSNAESFVVPPQLMETETVVHIPGPVPLPDPETS